MKTTLIAPPRPSRHIDAILALSPESTTPLATPPLCCDERVAAQTSPIGSPVRRELPPLPVDALLSLSRMGCEHWHHLVTASGPRFMKFERSEPLARDWVDLQVADDAVRET